MKYKLLILVVTYNGSATIANSLKALKESTAGLQCRVVIVDNHSCDNTVGLIQKLKWLNCDLVTLKKNIGVGAAYNKGLKAAKEWGFKWMLILDQDTVCQRETIQKLCNSARMLDREFSEQFGAVFPTPRSKKYPQLIHFPYRWEKDKLVLINKLYDEDHVNVDSSISSGALYSVKALDAVRGFNEDYFIDFVDHECHLRLKQHGWKMWWATRAEVLHSLGEFQQLIGNSLWIEHQAFRYYYIARNTSHGLYQAGGLKAVLFFWKEAIGHFRYFKQVNPRYLRCMLFFLKGILDAGVGRKGPLNGFEL